MLALAERVLNAPELAEVDPIAPGAANVVPPNVAALIEALQTKPVPLVQFNALDAELQFGIETAVGDALEPVAFATTVFAAWAEKAEVGTMPVAVSEPVIVGLAIVGEFDSTTDPAPVDVVTPVPPLAAVSGF